MDGLCPVCGVRLVDLDWFYHYRNFHPERYCGVCLKVSITTEKTCGCEGSGDRLDEVLKPHPVSLSIGSTREVAPCMYPEGCFPEPVDCEYRRRGMLTGCGNYIGGEHG